jgi:hypothetical protein
MCFPDTALRVPVKWEVFDRVGDITQNFDLLTSLARNQLCLKGTFDFRTVCCAHCQVAGLS